MKKFLLGCTALLGALLLCLISSNSLMHVGDAFFTRDQLYPAKFFYQLASVVNPFNTNLSNRLLAVDTNITERTSPTDEEARDPQLSQVVTTSTNVLGVSSCVPVLMYHYIRVNPWPTDTVGFGLSTPPTAFEEQLSYFKSQEYQTITLSQLKEYLVYTKLLDEAKKNKYIHLTNPPQPLPTKPLIITLDDGYQDAYTQGYPILKKLGMNAVEFVITGFVGLPNYLTWPEIQEMQESGVVDMQSHTVHHYALGSSYWSLTTIQNELTQSKNDLEQHLGKTVEWLAYPYGSVDDRVEQETAKVYYAAFGTNFGSYQSTEDEFTLPRIRVSGGDNGASVNARIHQALMDAKCIL